MIFFLIRKIMPRYKTADLGSIQYHSAYLHPGEQAFYCINLKLERWENISSLCFARGNVGGDMTMTLAIPTTIKEFESRPWTHHSSV